MLAISLCRRAPDFHKTFFRCNWCWPSSPSWSRLSRLQVAYYSVVSSTMTNMANIETTMVLKSNQEWISWAADALQLFESWRREVRQRDTNVNINVMIYVNIDINKVINANIDIDDSTLSQTATLRLPRREPAQGGASSAETRKRLPTHPADQVHRHLTEKGKFCSGANIVGFVSVILSPKHCHFYCQVYGLWPNEH